MGGKQKRAAKLKRFKEALSHQNLQAHPSSSAEQTDQDGQNSGNGSGDHSNSQSDLARMRQQILRRRQRKIKKQKGIYLNSR